MNKIVEAPIPDRPPAPRYRRLAHLSHWWLSLLVLACLLVGVNATYRLLQHSEAPPLRIILGEDSLTLDSSAAIRFKVDLEDRFSAQEQVLQQRVQSWEDEALAQLETSFTAASQAYLDWYFSPTGSYTRLAMAAFGKLDEWLEEQLYLRLAVPAGLETQWHSILEEYEVQLDAAQQAWLSDTFAGLYADHADRQIDLGSDDTGPALNSPTLDLDKVAGNAWQAHSDSPRWITAASAGAAIPATLLARRLAGGMAMQGARVVARQFATRLGIHASRSAVVGAGTAAASGPAGIMTGPMVAGASLALAAGTEYAILKVEEARQRPAMETELRNQWHELESQMREQLRAHLGERADSLGDQFKQFAAVQAEEARMPRQYRIFGDSSDLGRMSEK